MSLVLVLLQVLGGIIAIFANYKMFKVIKNDDKHQNFTSWSLWLIFDAIVAMTTVSADGNWILPVVYSFFSLAIVVMIVKKDGLQIHLIEGLTISIVVIFLVIVLWKIAGNITTIATCTIAIAISSIPQIKDTLKNPQDTPTLVYCYFLFAESISCFAGKSWAIEERFYAGVQLVVCIFIILLSLRRGKK